MQFFEQQVTTNLIALCYNADNWDKQPLLMEVEHKFANDFKANYITSEGKDTDAFLLLTSLPYSFSKQIDFNLEDIWPVKCINCKTVVYRHTMPTGNLQPEYMIIGDAPGVGDGELTSRFDRKWVYGPSSHLLREALTQINVYQQCWFSNLIRCSTQSNRPTTPEEVLNCNPYLIKEIELLKPKMIILLGNHVKTLFQYQNIPVVSVYHPSYFVRKNLRSVEYAFHIKDKLL